MTNVSDQAHRTARLLAAASAPLFSTVRASCNAGAEGAGCNFDSGPHAVVPSGPVVCEQPAPIVRLQGKKWLSSTLQRVQPQVFVPRDAVRLGCSDKGCERTGNRISPVAHRTWSWVQRLFPGSLHGPRHVVLAGNFPLRNITGLALQLQP